MQGGQQYIIQQQPGGQIQYGGAVIATQGQVQVVTAQPPSSGLVELPERDWNTGICGCCEDCESCCLALFFPWCYICSLSNRMGENCCTPFLIRSPIMIYRTKLRTKYNIKGSVICDCCCSCFCDRLAMCQIARELNHIEKSGIVAFPNK